MQADSFLVMPESYPSGSFSRVGENVRILTRNKAAHIPPLRPGQKRPVAGPIVVPTRRNVQKNRDNIGRIMRLATTHGSNLVVFLCSGEAKKEDIADIARAHTNLQWLAIDGPFLKDVQPYTFGTTKSLLAYGDEKDVAQKRNFALQLARLMRWDSLFFLDDDVVITSKHLDKAADLLRGDVLAVGFSARDFPDHSVTVFARRWVNSPIDSFIGTGALAVKTSGPILAYFPHLYNEDWFFLLVYCLFGTGGLVWAGTIKQRPFDPYKNEHRAESEEPGDLLGETLLKLAMQLKTDLQQPQTLEDFLQLMTGRADELFWENAINDRIVFIRTTLEQLRHKKMHPGRKRQASKALERSLEVLIGKDGGSGIQAKELAAWVQAWTADLRTWNKWRPAAPPCANIVDAIEQMNCDNEFLYNVGRSPGMPLPAAKPQDTEETLEVVVSEVLRARPDRPRTARHLRGLETTRIVQQYLENRGLGMEQIGESASRLRFDRPVFTLTYSKPELTICMFVAGGESAVAVSTSVQDIVRQHPNVAIELALWVYNADELDSERLEVYRNILVARLLPEIMGTNLRLRSGIVSTPYHDIDAMIDETVIDLAFAYWKCNIPVKHQVFVINSQNEPLRWGTFWEFMQHEHRIPSQPLKVYLREALSKAKGKAVQVMTKRDDELAAAQSRLELAGLRPEPTRPFWYQSPTSLLAKSMKQAGLSWLQLDDLAYDLEFYDAQGEDAIYPIERVLCLPVKYQDNLPSDMYVTAKKIIETIRGRQSSRPTACMIAICGGADHSWNRLQEYKKQLLEIITSNMHAENITVTAFVYQAIETTTTGELKKQLLTIARYAHWLQNHQRTPEFEWSPAESLKG
jgi:hypothetical protein